VQSLRGGTGGKEGACATHLSSKVSDLLGAVLVCAHKSTVGAFRDLSIGFRDGFGASGGGRLLGFVTWEAWDFHSIIGSGIEMGRMVRVLGERLRGRGISSVLFLVHVVLFLGVLEHLHLGIVGLRHEGGAGLVGERHGVGI
jgi:hypothetical protein